MLPVRTQSGCQNLSPPHLALPSQRMTQVDTPGCQHHFYNADRAIYANKTMRRRVTFLRKAFEQEFGSVLHFVVPPPPLWIQVIRFDTWHYRIPVWRGSQPFAFNPTSDLEVVAIVGECTLRGGCEPGCVDQWREQTAKMGTGGQS